MKIILISCLNFNKAIGYNNKLIYNLKNDINHFKKTTLKVIDTNKFNAVLMGRKTFISMGNKILKGRKNIVISTKNISFLEKYKNNKEFHIFNDINKSIEYCKKQDNIESLYVIGGTGIYDHFIKNNLADEIILTEITHPINNFGDVFFPKFDNKYKLIDSYSNKEDNVFCNVSKTYFPFIKYDINKYQNNNKSSFKLNSDESNYIDVLKDILYNGEMRQTRNSNTISKFGVRIELNNINENFPLLTTKKMYWKGIKEELLWFIKADTNSKNLEKKKVNIWKSNTSREFLDNNGFNNYDEGECGPIYGFQWRHFNGNYKENKNGYDQLQNCIDLIRTNPYSRRIFMSAWNPCQLNEMVLPPCHVSYQFYVTNDNKLDCQMYQRSGDLFLGVPFNIASTALLTSMIAEITGYKPGKIIIVIGDAHIYENHIEAVNEQILRTPYGFPKLYIKSGIQNIDDFQSNSFELISYHSHPPIKANMVA